MSSQCNLLPDEAVPTEDYQSFNVVKMFSIIGIVVLALLVTSFVLPRLNYPECKDHRVTAVFMTCCGRHQQLKEVIQAFHMHNQSPIYEKLIVYDGELEDELIHIHELYSNMSIFTTGTYLGLAKTLDLALNYVQTPYIYYTTDHQKMNKGNVIKEAIEGLETDPKSISLWTSDSTSKNGRKEDYYFNPAVWRTADIHTLQGGFQGLTSDLSEKASAKEVNNKIENLYKTQGMTLQQLKGQSYTKVQ